MAEDPNVSEASRNCSSYSSTAVEAELSAKDDIKPRVYEGGFKTWECAVDLASYLTERSEEIVSSLRIGGLHVIEVSRFFFQRGLALVLLNEQMRKIYNTVTARRRNRASNNNSPPNPPQQTVIVDHLFPPSSHTLGLQRDRAPFIYNTQYTSHLPTSCIPNSTAKIFRTRVISFLPFQLRIKPLS